MWYTYLSTIQQLNPNLKIATKLKVNSINVLRPTQQRDYRLMTFKIYGDNNVKELHGLAFNIFQNLRRQLCQRTTRPCIQYRRLYCEFVSEPNGALERELKAINIGMIGKYRWKMILWRLIYIIYQNVGKGYIEINLEQVLNQIQIALLTLFMLVYLTYLIVMFVFYWSGNLWIFGDRKHVQHSDGRFYRYYYFNKRKGS